jgi:pimeloyl-ACP methyl ester carboxylesterase
MQPHTRSSSRRIWQPMGTLAALILALPCGAQRQPLVMTHGIRSNPTTWDQAAITLPGAFPVSIVRDTTTWTKSYFFQANELLDSVFTGLPDSTLAVGHSNGGLVLRQSILLNAPLRGLVTVGSPNKGAPAADAIRKNYMGDIISPILVHGQAISYALSPPDWTDPDEQWYYDYVAATGSNMIDLVNSILAAMEFDPSFEIWNSMYPSSAFMQSVGSPASLAIQHQRVPIRASIRTYIDDEKQAFWRLVIAPENVAYFEGIRDFASTIALLAGFYYTDKYCYLQPYQQGKCNASSLFFDLSTDLLLIEGRYCYKITVENAVGAYPFPCFASDAVVPLGNQTWGPVDINAPPDSALRLYDIQGPSHTEQPKSQAVRNSIEAFLQNQANVARCGLGPVYEVQIAAQSTDILPGSTTQLSVTAYDRCLAGLLFPPAIGSVSSSNPSVATVSAGTGAVNVSGISNGVATITVVMNGIAATRSVAVGAGTSLSVEVSGGPRENLSVGETVWLYANVTPSGQPVSYEWRVNGGAVISTASAYGHYFQGTSTISVTVTGSVGQTAYASAYLSGGGNEFRIQKHRPPVSGRP